MQTNNLREHEEDCKKKVTGEYCLGCPACVIDMIKESKKALQLEYRDRHKDLDNADVKRYEEKITFYTTLETLL